MIKPILSFFVLFVCFANAAQAQLKATKLDSAQVPKSIKYTGKFNSALRWTDQLGDNLVVTVETGIYRNPKFKHESEGSDAELFAYHYIIKERAEQTWKIYDFIKDCDFDIVASFIKNTLQVTDLNNDGIGEVWVMYKTACTSDVSPFDMKIIMYQGQQKYAMRGHNKVQLTKNESYGGDYKFDNAFNAGPKVFREFALKLWNKNILQSWGQ